MSNSIEPVINHHSAGTPHVLPRSSISSFSIQITNAQMASSLEEALRDDPCTDTVVSSEESKSYCEECKTIILPWKLINTRASFHRNVAELNECGRHCSLCAYLASYILRSPEVLSPPAEVFTVTVRLYPTNGQRRAKADIPFEYCNLHLEIGPPIRGLYEDITYEHNTFMVVAAGSMFGVGLFQDR
jgi:hypothetical protein